VFMYKKKTRNMSPLHETFYRFCQNKVSMIGLVVVVMIILIMLFGEYISPYELGVKQNIRMRLQGPSAAHWFGTDAYGRDIFTRVLHGTKYTMMIAFPATFTAELVGIVLGACAAFYSRWFDNILMRVLDVFQAIPAQLLALAVVAALGGSLINLIIALLIARIPASTRTARSIMLSLVGQEYIDAARSYGSRDYHMIFRHIIPNALGAMIVNMTINLSSSTLQVSSMSYIGLGVSPPTPEWGALLSEAREFIITAPHLIIFPGIAILLTALSFNLVGDGLRDALDPRLRD
jgi:peptide/nickel transport system permease protein